MSLLTLSIFVDDFDWMSIRLVVDEMFDFFLVSYFIVCDKILYVFYVTCGE